MHRLRRPIVIQVRHCAKGTKNKLYAYRRPHLVPCLDFVVAAISFCLFLIFSTRCAWTTASFFSRHCTGLAWACKRGSPFCFLFFYRTQPGDLSCFSCSRSSPFRCCVKTTCAGLHLSWYIPTMTQAYMNIRHGTQKWCQCQKQDEVRPGQEINAAWKESHEIVLRQRQEKAGSRGCRGLRQQLFGQGQEGL